MNKYMSKIQAPTVFQIFAKVRKTSLALVMSIALIVPSISQAGRVDEPPTAAAMFGDAMVRPVMAGATVIGAGLWVGTLPFSLLGGNAKQAGEALVLYPFHATFLRCLGCTNANAGAFGGTRPVE